MTILYKLTTQDFTTRAGEYNETKWGEGVQHTTPCGKMCTNQVIHAYTSPALALFLNPIHANIPNPIIWECDGDICCNDRGLKVGCTRLRTERKIEVVSPTLRQIVIFAILCVKSVLPVDSCPAWHDWADKYVSGAPGSNGTEFLCVPAIVALGARLGTLPRRSGVFAPARAALVSIVDAFAALLFSASLDTEAAIIRSTRVAVAAAAASINLDAIALEAMKEEYR